MAARKVAIAQSGYADLDFYSVEELKFIGFERVGKNCRVSRKVSFYAISGFLDHDVRIDDFSILKGRIEIGPFVHINSHNMISGARAAVAFKGFCGTGVGVAIFTASDDHRANTLNNACTPEQFVTTIEGPVTIGIGTIIGTYVTILPNVEIGHGASIGAGSVVSFNVPAGGIARPAPTVLLDRVRDADAILGMADKIIGDNR